MESSLFVEVSHATNSPRQSVVIDLLRTIESQTVSMNREEVDKATRRSIQQGSVGYKALVRAIELGKMDAVNFLLDNNCKVNLGKKSKRSSNTPLHLAVKMENFNLIERLLKANASLAAADERGNTPLHLAVKIGNLKLVERLLEANAPVTAPDEKGNTPLHLAFLLQNEAIMDMILMAIQKKSKYANMRNAKGLTHMHIACAMKKFVVMKRFLNQSMLTISPAVVKKKMYRKVIVKEEC